MALEKTRLCFSRQNARFWSVRDGPQRPIIEIFSRNSRGEVLRYRLLPAVSVSSDQSCRA